MIVITYKSTYPDWSATWSSVQPKAAVETPDAFDNARAEAGQQLTAGLFKYGDLAWRRGPSPCSERRMVGATLRSWIQLPSVNLIRDQRSFANKEVDAVTGLINSD